MRTITHLIFLELITSRLKLAKKTKNKFNNVDIEKEMKEYFETCRDLIKDVEFTKYDYRQQKFLLPYITKLVNYLTEEELILLNERLKTAKVKRGFFTLINSGVYDPKENKLTYYLKKAIGHELIHLATSYYVEEMNLKLAGFYVYDSKFGFGFGLNEGYTELLASRIFNKNNRVTASYGLVKICRILELFFDNPEDMRKLFFSCNLMGVIEKLKEYMPEEEIYAIIFELDAAMYDIIARIGLDSPSLRRVRAILYRRFMDKCTDENKRKEMGRLLSINPIKKASIKYMARKISGATAATNVNSVLKNRIKSAYKSAGAIALSYVSLLGLQHYSENVAMPYSTAFELVEHAASEGEMLDFNSADYLCVRNGKFIESFEGKYICQALTKENIKCCQIDEEFYTIDGSDIQINTYEAMDKKYYCDGTPVFQNGTIIDYSFQRDEFIDSQEGSYYTIENGIVYSYLPVIIKETVLSDGVIVASKNSSDTYVSKELVNSQTISTKPYEDMSNQQLICDYKNSGIGYTLQYKKN